MNKKQLLERADSIGLDIVKLVNEFRTSSGEKVNYDEEYFKEFFAGVVAFLCTGDGEVTIEYESDPKYNLIDGLIKTKSHAEHFLGKKHVCDKYSAIESVHIVDGKPEKTYSQEMDPITYNEVLKRTSLAGDPLIKPEEVLKRGV